MLTVSNLTAGVLNSLQVYIPPSDCLGQLFEGITRPFAIHVFGRVKIS